MPAALAPTVLLDAVRRAREQRAAEGSLYEFVRQAWPSIEPGVAFIPSWHLEVICEHLEAVTSGEIRRLLINIPPRHSKSTIISVAYPCWEWLASPHEKYLCASYSGVLAIRDNLKARRLVSSPWYQERWGHLFKLTGDQNAKQRFENDKTGYRIATSVGGTATGEGGSRLILDDAISTTNAQSDAVRESTLDWLDMEWSTRLNDPKRDAMIEVAQRSHERDPSGHRLKQGGWEHVCIPAEYDGVRRKTSIFVKGYDPRATLGELICPERFGEKEIESLKAQLGAYGTAGQLQQAPAPKGGGILRVEHFQRWPHDRELPAFDFVVQSYDTAFEQKEENDPSAATAWGVFLQEGKYCVMLLDAWAERLTYPELRAKTLEEWQSRYGVTKTRKGRRADVALIEKKASGQSLLQDLRAANIPVAPYLPQGGKVPRAHQVAPILELDCMYILESAKQPGLYVSWARPFVEQCERFPNSEHDDYVDTFTQAMIYLRDAGWFELGKAEREEEVDMPPPKKRAANPYAA